MPEASDVEGEGVSATIHVLDRISTAGPGMVPGVRALIRPRFLLAAAAAGVAAGLIGIAMALLLGLFESLFYGVTHGGLLERLAATAPAARRGAPSRPTELPAPTVRTWVTASRKGRASPIRGAA